MSWAANWSLTPENWLFEFSETAEFSGSCFIQLAILIEYTISEFNKEPLLGHDQKFLVILFSDFECHNWLVLLTCIICCH